jgi:hypothetical protein
MFGFLFATLVSTIKDWNLINEWKVNPWFKVAVCLFGLLIGVYITLFILDHSLPVKNRIT